VTTMLGGVLTATKSLEIVLDQLQAHRVTAYWQTGPGVVELTVPGPHLLVNGSEVATEEDGSG
jgi:hypothetical protein